MPKGLKETSSPLVVSFTVAETTANTFTTERVDLQLNALDNEVFVVTGVKMDLEMIDVLSGAGNLRYGVFASVSKQDITTQANSLSNPSVIATANVQALTDISAQPSGDNWGVALIMQENDTDAPQALEYLDIIATPDFFVNINGVSQSSAKSVAGKLYGYRARADASTYAALVQSELLSS